MMKQLLSHFGFSFFSSFLNYIFFVFLARELGEGPFGLFSLHWARLSFFLFLATIVYYWSALKLPSKRVIHFSFCVLHGVCWIGLVFSYFKLAWPVLYLILIAASVAQSLLSGYLIGTGNYVKHGQLNFGMALEKIVLIFFIASYGLAPHNVFILIYAAYLMLHLALPWWLKNIEISNSERSFTETFLPTVLLALMVHFLPNMDILFFSRADGEIAMYSLVTKGIFFVQLALAQFFLSKDKDYLRITWSPLKVVVIALIVAIPMAWMACKLIQFSFQWKTEFDYWVMYLAIISGMSITLFFQVYQHLLLHKWNLKLLIAPALISVLWATGQVIQMNLAQYYGAVGIMFLFLSGLSLKLKNKEALGD